VIALVLGGARSGKSVVAEDLAARLAAGEPGGPVTYVATASDPGDDPEWAARITAHRARRPSGWRTVEAGAEDLASLLSGLEGVALVDSLGSWLARRQGFDADTGVLCETLLARNAHTVLVSEEVGLGVHPSSAAGRLFRDALGALNQQVAEVSDPVLLVVAGRCLALARRGPAMVVGL
jgi:adenosylcobinamide kinase/adenosylcobinamide-phosphate guanylyltransferase